MSLNRTYPFLSFLLAFLILFNTSGIYLIGKIETFRHRNANMQQEESETSVTLHLTTAEVDALHWVGERDFIYEGKHYDIHRVEQTGDHCRVICEQDAHETALHAVMKNQLGHDHGTDSKHTSKNQSSGIDCVLHEHVAFFANETTLFSFPEAKHSKTGAAFIPFLSPPPEA